MVECTLMATPMITNLNNLSSYESKLVDLMVYRHLIVYFMYLVNTQPNICFSVNTISQYMVELMGCTR